MGLFFVVILFLDGCQNNRNEQPISLKSVSPILLEKNGVEIFQYWEFRNEDYLWDTHFAQPASLKLYADSVRNILGRDTLNFIIKQRAFQDSSYASINTYNGDSLNAQLIHSNTLGKIRPINYLESELIGYQISRYPLLSHPTEFHGFIVFHDSSNLVRVYFAASDQPWPPKPAIILQMVKTDLTMGWTLKYHLHNHYEPKANHYLGILAPSVTDAQYYLFLKDKYNLNQSLITNGFHTVEIKKEEFAMLRSPEN